MTYLTVHNLSRHIIYQDHSIEPTTARVQ